MACPRCDGPGRNDGFYGLCERCTVEVREWAAKQGAAAQARAEAIRAERDTAEVLPQTPWWNRKP